MFTGIIEEIGTITSVENNNGGFVLTIRCTFAGELNVDDSVAVNGICLTVVSKTDSSFTVDAVEETIRKTSLNQYAEGSQVNLERALTLSGRLDGHLVQGHVDATGTVTRLKVLENSREYTVSFDDAFKDYVIPKG